MSPAEERAMFVGQAAPRPYGLAPPEGRPASAALPRLTYTVAEVAEMLGRSRQNVYDLINEGRLSAHRMTKRGTVIRACDLEAFLSSMEEV